MVNKHNVVLGWIEEIPDGAEPHATAEEIMEAGPSTFRPHVAVDDVADYMRRSDLEQALVTTSDGKLVGLFKAPR